MSNMSEERTIGVDEVQAAIDLGVQAAIDKEVSVLKKAIELIVEQVVNIADHMNKNLASHNVAIKETMEKHNGLAQMVIAMGDFIKTFDCIKPEE